MADRRRLRCWPKEVLQRSLARIAEHGNGAVIYLRDPNAAGVAAAAHGRPLTQNDENVVSEILADLGAREIRLLTVDQGATDLCHARPA
jgi:GTP cyclohydrolase II